MNLAFEAMRFAQAAHKNQTRKYTGNPYSDHLAEVAGIAATVLRRFDVEYQEPIIATAWLHDCVEDCGVTLREIEDRFGFLVALGVSGLTDAETGVNRAERKAKGRERLAACAGWIQTVKCADLISNTSSIVKHDPKFAQVYLEEKRLLLEVMTQADPQLRELAFLQTGHLGRYTG